MDSTPTIPTISLQSPPVRRDRSYRKPVPDYVPSPPASPAVTTPDLLNPMMPSEHEGGSLSLQIPGGWQKQNALTQEAVTAQEKRMVDVSSPDVIFTFLQSEPSIPPDDCEKSPSSPGGTRRGLPQIYRPPTPPLGSAAKKRKLHEDSNVDNHDFLTVPHISYLNRSNENPGSYPPPLIRTATAAGSSRSTFHPLSNQASFRTDKTSASDTPTFNARAHEDDQWHDLPVLPMYIVKPPQRRGSGNTTSTKAGSEGSFRSTFQTIGCLLRNAFCCCRFHEV